VDGDHDLRTAGGLVVPAEGLTWSFARSSGAGGQYVNKTSTRVTLDVDLARLRGPAAAVERSRRALVGGLRVSSQTTRSQWRNRQECLARAAQLLDDAATAPGVRRPSRPTRGSVERRLAAKRRDSDKKRNRRSTDW
jgi:ribosome-associated protein